jgi:two-component system response regulator HydG
MKFKLWCMKKQKKAVPTAKRILAHINDSLVVLDLAGRIRYYNEGFCEMAGGGNRELMGKRLCELFDQHACAQIDPGLIPLDKHSGQIHYNVELPDGQGNQRAYCFSATTVFNARGKQVGVLENFRDMNALRNMIMQLKEVNEAIQGEKEKAERIIDSIADGIFTVDEDLTIRSFSPRMEQLTGLSQAQAVGRKCPDVLKGSKCKTDCPLIWTFGHRAVVERCRETFRPDSGRIMQVSVTTAFLQDEHGQPAGLIGIVRDHTEVERLRKQLHERHSFRNIIGRSSAMQEVFQKIEAVSASDVTVLIEGETGTGKEVVAQAIHHMSERRDGPFVSLNCAALNDNLLESELFGHIRGAFTGAVADRPGRFELAAGGTLFLDEIGDTSPALQSKLLRVLEEKAFERVGDTRTHKVDVRIIAATHRDLPKVAREGRFREDLYFRLAVMPIHLPPLRDRREDIPLLVQHMIDKYRPKYMAGREEQFEGISNRALALLLQYDWPGNVRELEHAIEHAMISTTTNRIERAFLPASIRRLQPSDSLAEGDTAPPASSSGEDGPLGASAIRSALAGSRWNVTKAAAILGISRTTLWRRMKELRLER